MMDKQNRLRTESLPMVSVVIPAYNAQEFLAEAIDSVLSQDYAHLELIIVDDGSTDRTGEIAKAYGERLKYIRQANSGGCSSPRNNGVKAASGEFITFLDADDLMSLGKIKRQIEFLSKNPPVCLVLSDYQNFDSSGCYSCTHFQTCTEFLRKTDLNLPDGEVILDSVTAASLLIQENFSSACSPMFRISAFKSSGGFDETLKASEDFHLVYRLARSQPIGVLGMVGFLRRFHELNMSGRSYHIIAYKILSRQMLLKEETDSRLKALLRKALAGLHLALAEYLVQQHESGAIRNVLSAFKYRPIPSIQMAKVLVKISWTFC